MFPSLSVVNALSPLITDKTEGKVSLGSIVAVPFITYPIPCDAVPVKYEQKVILVSGFLIIPIIPPT